MKQIPNLVTLLNLFLGCMAVIFILQNGIDIVYTSDGAQMAPVPERIWLASLCIGLAAVVDFLDGWVARLFKAGSALGKELDSLADVVSFGVAPGMIMYQFLRWSFAQQQDGMDISMVYLLPALIVPCAAAYRLARFNIDPAQEYGFRGIPSPAAGLFVASLPLIYWNAQDPVIVRLLLNKWVLYGIILFVSYGMVSNWPLLSFKMKDFSFKNNLPRYLLVILAIAAALFIRWLAVPVVFILYIVLSLAFKNRKQ